MVCAVAIVRSSINAFAGGWRIPDFVTGPLHSFSADFTIMLIALENSITDIVSATLFDFPRMKIADKT